MFAAWRILSSRLPDFQTPLQMKNKLRELRAAKEWSQSDLAEKLEVSRQTVNAIETEKYDPSLPLAFKVARLFKLPIEDIFDLAHNDRNLPDVALRFSLTILMFPIFLLAVKMNSTFDIQKSLCAH